MRLPFPRTLKPVYEALDDEFSDIDQEFSTSKDRLDALEARGVQLAAALSGDIELAIVQGPDAEVGLTDINAGLELPCTVRVQTAGGVVHEWFHGTLPFTVATSSSGVVEDSTGNPYAEVAFADGVAEVPLVCSGTWVNDETITVTTGAGEDFIFVDDLELVHIPYKVES